MTMRIAVPMAVIIPLAASPVALAQSTGAGPRTEEKSAPGAGTAAQMVPSELAAKRRLEEAGYTNVRDVKSSAEGLSAKAVKDGKEFEIVVDSFGKIIARPAR